ncbi:MULTISPECIES: DUF3899 domain-containing protein [Enterococcus]|uniref:DUF3899 domain-containing protein n=2 Tax=root TaxID=1 RepID=A0A179ERU9_ENTTH|nr:MULTISPECIES: DUF3899 domain-containing protein [Enterococcus]ASZ08202.1 DUF3899 domain-containing protein [Enterococcus thailandicus]MDA3965971.1 DUF3899 domain-containing protein [Enterococcus thailandicus]MDK4352852.1 DUF3899 domain-containing protein [Enterococcus thailandicus]MDT2734794.1 DUF3899 domain-containing protein [Enterococcus thailandicus]MDT2751750.1 DUF3899 domain-containing protein [Enterococcus thailandicus]
MNKKYLPYAISILLMVLILIKNFLTNQLTFLQLSNDSFLCALPFLIIGGFLWVFSSGFFDHFQRSIHLARTRNRKKKPEFSLLSSASHGMYSFWLIIAGILLIFSILFMLFALL